MMKIHLEEIIDIISDNIPEFLDMDKILDRAQYDNIHSLIIISKILAVKDKIRTLQLKEFTLTFISIVKNIIEIDHKAEESYEYIQNFYDQLLDHCENEEEYEICVNIKNFFIMLKKYTEDNETENEKN